MKIYCSMKFKSYKDAMLVGAVLQCVSVAVALAAGRMLEAAKFCYERNAWSWMGEFAASGLILFVVSVAVMTLGVITRSEALAHDWEAPDGE